MLRTAFGWGVRRKSRASSALLLLILFGFTALTRAQTADNSDPQQVRAILVPAIARVAQIENLIVDPRIVDQMVVSLGIYVFNFCSTPAEDCSNRMTSKSPDIESAVRAHLKALQELPASPVQVFGDRLAKGKFPLVGWPTHQIAEGGLVALPPKLHFVDIYMRFATGVILIGRGKTLLAPPGPITLEATLDKQSERWTVSVPLRKTVNLDAKSGTTVEARPLQPLPSAMCKQTAAIPYRGPLSLFNQGRAKFAEESQVRIANEAPYLGQHVIDISVATKGNVTCDAACQYALSALFADSVATWRAGCTRCAPNALVSMRANSHLWIDWRIARRLRIAASGRSVELDLSKADVNEGPLVGIQPFADLSADGPVREQLCSTHPDAAPWVGTVQHIVCEKPTTDNRATKILRPSVTLLGGLTACGEGAIACGLPAAGVEVSLRDYRYMLPGLKGTNEIVIGPNRSGEILDMRHVILHEVGHWFGVPHSQVAGPDQFLDVMSQGYGEGQSCLSGHSMRMLSNAGDLRWNYRVKEGGALLAPQSKRRRVR